MEGYEVKVVRNKGTHQGVKSDYTMRKTDFLKGNRTSYSEDFYLIESKTNRLCQK